MQLFPAYHEQIWKHLQFPFLPLTEQRRIATILKEQMAGVEKARTAAQARLEAVKALPAAFLRQVFPNPANPSPKAGAGSSWGKCAYSVEDLFGGSLRKEIFVQSGYAVYEQRHCDLQMIFPNVAIISAKKNLMKCAALRFVQAISLWSCSGTMGKVAIIPENAPAWSESIKPY